MERPLLLPLAALIVGLVAADRYDLSAPLWTLPALLAVTLAACFVSGRAPFLLSAAALFLCWGILSLQPYLHPKPGLQRWAGDDRLTVEGRVAERPEGVPAGGSRVVLTVDRLWREKVPLPGGGRLLLFVKTGRVALKTGDRIACATRLRQPRMYGLPGERDYGRQLAYRGIFVTGFVAGAEDLVLLRAGTGWRAELDRLNCRLGSFVDRYSYEPERGVLKALLLGDRGEVPPWLNDAYARSGVNHILSISGFHVGIIYLCLFQTLYLLGRLSESLALRLNLKRWSLFLALPVVLFYLFLSGAAPATLRSVLMIGAVAAAFLVEREVDPINGIMLAALAILAAAPSRLFELSFQLSFLAIWGLVLFTPPVERLLAGVGPWLRWPALVVVASAAAMAATVVPVAYYFHRVALVGLIANLLVVPLMGYGAVLLGFVALTLSSVWSLGAGSLLALAGWLVRLSDLGIGYLARAPVGTGYRPEQIDFLLACLLMAALTFVKELRLRIGSAGLLFVALVLSAFARPPQADALRATFLSVGQGDATLVRLPGGGSMLIDGGGSQSDAGSGVGERLLAPALWRLGVDRIDYLVLSHPHPDHIQGVLWAAAQREVGEFWESGVASDAPEYQQLKWILAARGVPVRQVNAGIPRFALGPVLVEPLWPRPGTPPDQDANGNSLVFKLSYGRSSLLFTGDLGLAAEQELISEGRNLGCSILKVAHHGSRYSTGAPFLAAAAPATAVISAGYRNYFGLPAPATLSRLEARRVTVYRTDLEGSIDAACRADGGCRISAPWGHFH